MKENQAPESKEDHLMSDLVDVNQAAKNLGLSRHFLYRKVKAGQVPHYRAGRAVRLDLSEVRNWMRSQAQVNRDDAKG